MTEVSSISEEELIQRLNGFLKDDKESGYSVLRVMLTGLRGVQAADEVRMSVNIASGGSGLASGGLHKTLELNVDESMHVVEVMLSFILRDGRVLGAGAMRFDPMSRKEQVWAKTIDLVSAMQATITFSLDCPLPTPTPTPALSPAPTPTKRPSITSNMSEAALITLLSGQRVPSPRTPTIPDTPSVSSYAGRDSLPPVSPRDADLDTGVRDSAEGIDPRDLAVIQEKLAIPRLATLQHPEIASTFNELCRQVPPVREPPCTLQKPRVLSAEEHVAAVANLASADGDVVAELLAKLRTPRTHDALRVLSYTGYALSITTAVVAAHPELTMLELVCVLLATCQPIDVDMLLKWDPAGDDTSYTSQYADTNWSGAAGLRNGSLVASTELFPLWHGAVAACCTAHTHEVYKGVDLDSSKLPFKEGDTIGWGCVTRGVATEQDAAARVSKGTRGVLFHIKNPTMTLPLKALHYHGKTECLLSPLMSYTVLSVEFLVSDIWSCKVVLQCAPMLGTHVGDFLSATKCHSLKSNERLQKVIRSKLAEHVFPGHKGVQDEVEERMQGSAREQLGELLQECSVCRPYEAPRLLRAKLESIEAAHVNEMTAAGHTNCATEVSSFLSCEEAQRTALVNDCIAAAYEGTADLHTDALKVLSVHSDKHQAVITKLAHMRGVQTRCVEQDVRGIISKAYWQLRLATELKRRRRRAMQHADILRRSRAVAAAACHLSLMQRYWDKWSGYSLFRAYRQSQVELAEVKETAEALRLTMAGQKVDRIETSARQLVALEEAAGRSEMEGWEAGFWRRENVYNERKRKVDEHQSNLLQKLIETMKPLVGPSTPDVTVTSQTTRLTKVESTALQLVEQLSHELTSLRGILQKQSITQAVSAPLQYDRAALLDLQEAIMEGREMMLYRK